MTLEELEKLADSGFYAGEWQDTSHGVLISGHDAELIKWDGELSDTKRLSTLELIAATPSLLTELIAAKKREIELVDALRDIRVSLGNVGEVVWRTDQPETMFDYVTRMIGDGLTWDEFDAARLETEL